MHQQLLATWKVHNQKTYDLVDYLQSDHFSLRARSRSRTISDQLIHLHTARKRWLDVIKPSVADLEKPDKSREWDKKSLLSLLQSSENAVKLLVDASQKGNKLKRISGGITRFVGYLISHESHHRGQILQLLKANQVKLEPSFQYGLWDWK